MRMGRMLLAAQAIDDPQIEPFKRCECAIVEFGHVGRIGKSSDPETQCRAKAVILRERHNTDATNLERSDDFVWNQRRLVETSRVVDRLEHIPEATADFGQSFRVGIKWYGSSHQPINRSQVVNEVQTGVMCMPIA